MSASQLDSVSSQRSPVVSMPHEGEGDSDLSLVAAINVVLRRRLLVMRLVGVLVALAITLALLRPQTYTSSTSFVPQTSRGPTSAGGGIAAQLGLSALTSDPTQS